MLNVITIGGAGLDMFVESDTAHIISIRGMKENVDLYCLKYGEKIEIDHSSFDFGGGAVNTAVSFSKLGLKTGIVAKMGSGTNSSSIIERLTENNIDSSLVIRDDAERTGFSIILTSFEGDRTVLAHRGANATLKPNEINWEGLKNTEWIYSAPLSCDFEVLEELAKFAEKNNIKFAYNAGSKALSQPFEKLEPILKTVEILTLNTSEASKILGIDIIPEIKKKSIIHPQIKDMMKKLKEYVKQFVIITDGKKGAYAYDGKDFYYAETYPAKPVSSLGAGDAFASTVVGSIIKGFDIKKALALASINSAYVVLEYAAQTGLQTIDKLEEILSKAKDLDVITVKD